MTGSRAEDVLCSCSVSEANDEMLRRCQATERALGAAMILDWSGNTREALDVAARAALVICGDPTAESALARLDFRRFGEAAEAFASVAEGAQAFMNRLDAKLKGTGETC